MGGCDLEVKCLMHTAAVKAHNEAGWNIRTMDKLIEGFPGQDTETLPPGGGSLTFPMENSLPRVLLYLVHFQGRIFLDTMSSRMNGRAKLMGIRKNVKT